MSCSAALCAVVLSSIFHEWGHYIAALALRHPVSAVQIGFGPAMLQFGKSTRTVWTVCIWPVGGCVVLHDTGPASRSIFKRSLVVASGPGANIFLAVILFAIAVFWFHASAQWAFYDRSFGSAFTLFAFASLAIAVFNLLPLPPLDGGVLCLLALQALRKRPVTETHEKLARRLGTFVIYALTVYAVAWLALTEFR